MMGNSRRAVINSYSFQSWQLAFDTGAPLRDRRNADRQVPVNRHFAEQGFDRACFGYRCRRECTEIILNAGEALGYIGVPNRDNRRLGRGMVENVLQESAGRVG